jgi:hypothetical protein
VKNEDGKEIVFKKTWDHQRIDKWVRGLMPDVFHFLDHRYPENARPAYHWVLLNKDRLKLYVMKRPITGELLEEVKGLKSKTAGEHAIRIGELPISSITPHGLTSRSDEAQDPLFRVQDRLQSCC